MDIWQACMCYIRIIAVIVVMGAAMDIPVAITALLVMGAAA